MSGISDTPIWKRLEEDAAQLKQMHLKDLLQDEARCAALTAEHNGIYFDFSRQNVLPGTMDHLFDLAEAAGLEQKKADMASGKHINATEDRAVMHMALRAPANKEMMVDGANVVPEVHAVLQKIAGFADKVRSGQWLGATGKKLTNVVSIGIGGSYLGPEFVFEALKTHSEARTAASGRVLRFLANVDPVDVSRAIEGLDPETTLVVVVSKTFTTAETMLNARTMKKWLTDSVPGAATDVIRQHMIAVSSAIPKAVDFGIDANNVFGFWDWVGGRFSVCSAVGVMPLTLQYGFPIVEQFLSGAHDMDTHFLTAPLRNNLPVLLGLLGLWNSSFLGHSSRAILGYSQALLRFAAHIQQVDMESNGKRVDMTGSVVPFETGEINFGEPGTNGQHSFYQLVHQGRVIPAEFIGFCVSPCPMSLPGEPVSNHDELMSNFFAQPDALATGKSLSDLQADNVPFSLQSHKTFPGNRPSLSLLLSSLSPFSLGQLLALYEHRVAVQGFIWGINSFDQWGVELGKSLANKVRKTLSEARGGSGVESVSGYNPSTTRMLKKYLAQS
eukprot:CAMPEP_0182416968 /NCGR_PEP_ID=MMETSP1167-20130531/1382_1 /TAXON_ID=2988 /ORGANISM="Mallomonas Sp, Strain CCMP3275" /LENGTH=556 /DNA_ID=CAMNT_0024590191 /DNA_START=78 /DNA_END=1748 /DNA_ORIENTATION=+